MRRAEESELVRVLRPAPHPVPIPGVGAEEIDEAGRVGELKRERRGAEDRDEPSGSLQSLPGAGIDHAQRGSTRRGSG